MSAMEDYRQSEAQSEVEELETTSTEEQTAVVAEEPPPASLAEEQEAAAEHLTGSVAEHLPESAPPGCYLEPLWTSEDGEIRFHGRPFHLRGINWFGLDTPQVVANLFSGGPGLANVLEGRHTVWKELMRRMDLLHDHGINAIRLPVPASRANDLATVITDTDYKKLDKSAGEIIHIILDGAAKRGMVVMLDLHRMEPCCQPGEAWFGNETWEPKEAWTSAWMALLERFGDHPALFAIDLFNEPHGKAGWGAGAALDWHAAASELISTILEKHPQYLGLFVVQGIGGGAAATEAPPASSFPHRNSFKYFWGENLEGAWSIPITAGGNRVAYEAHVLGPGTASPDFYSASDFPSNMPKVWDAHLGWVEKRTGQALVLGEWGGVNTGKDAEWQSALADYLVKHCLSDAFYWTIQPSSRDTGGWLLDLDTDEVDPAKMTLLQRVQPHPTFFGDTRKGHFCFKRQGSYASETCAARAWPWQSAFNLFAAQDLGPGAGFRLAAAAAVVTAVLVWTCRRLRLRRARRRQRSSGGTAAVTIGNGLR